jgi:hypothetical protein
MFDKGGVILFWVEAGSGPGSIPVAMAASSWTGGVT